MSTVIASCTHLGKPPERYPAGHIFPPETSRKVNWHLELEDWTNGKSIVGVGEAQHFSEGLNLARAELLKELVLLGFRSVFIETQDAGLAPLKHYIDSDCRQAPSYADFGHMFEGWKTESNAQLFHWLCKYNQGHPEDKVTIYGFEVNTMGAIGGETVHQALKEISKRKGISFPESEYDSNIVHCLAGGVKLVDPYRLKAEKEKELEAFLKIYSESGLDTDVKELESCRAAFEIAEHWIDKLVNPQAEVALNNIKAANDLMFYQALGRSRDSSAARDLGMANSILLARDHLFPGKKVILWAATAHLNKNSLKGSAPNASEVYADYTGIKLLGQRLYEIVGDEYFLIHITASVIKSRCSKRYSYCRREVITEYTSPGPSWESLISKNFGEQAALVKSSDPMIRRDGVEGRSCQGLGQCGAPWEHFDAVYWMRESPPRAPLPDSPTY